MAEWASAYVGAGARAQPGKIRAAAARRMPRPAEHLGAAVGACETSRMTGPTVSNLAELARLAGVSVSTVSRSLAGNPGIAAATRQ